MLHEGSTLIFYLLKYILLQPLDLLAFSQISSFTVKHASQNQS